MIAPMKKFVLVLLDGDAAVAPLQLRKLGIAHLERIEGEGKTCAALEAELKDAIDAQNLLSSSMDKRRRAGESLPTDARKRIQDALRIKSDIDALQAKAAELRREAERLSPWGDFSPELVSGLGAGGVPIAFVECRPEQLSALPEECDFIRIAAPKGKVRMALIGAGQAPAPFETFRIPASRLSAVRAELAGAEAGIAERKASLAAMADGLPLIEKEITRLKSALVIENLKTGMPREGELRYLCGYVPAKTAPLLAQEAAKRRWGLSLDDPADDEMPPTKVENPPAVRIIQPVFNFLGTVPNYREYDISLSFLIFFAVYFAMIFGDGGYGIILLAGALGMLFSARRSNKPISDFVKLLFVLSGTTILWGFLTATWFAIPYESLPAILQNWSLTALNSGNPDSGTNTKILCFIIGAIQLAIAHLKNIRRDFPNPKFLSQVGSLIMVVGMFDAVLNLVIDSSRFPLYGWAVGLIGAGFMLVFTFGNWNGNLISSLLEGLKGIIPTFLGTVSVFADIVSYIRLWAVGLAGLAISQTVNGMAVGMFGPVSGRIVAFIVGAVFGLILIFVGHTINLLMSVLSVIVHGIRLNMLEYSSHLGMEWSGYKYEPLCETAEEEKLQEKVL
jgi:V/A-type H+-transporting ATPase subunit I